MDHAHDDNEKRHRRQLRPGHVPEALPAVGAVDGRGFVEFDGHVAQPGKVKQHVVGADRRPKAHDHDRRLGPAILSQPLGRLQAVGGHRRQPVQNVAQSQQNELQNHEAQAQQQGVAHPARRRAGEFASFFQRGGHQAGPARQRRRESQNAARWQFRPKPGAGGRRNQQKEGAGGRRPSAHFSIAPIDPERAPAQPHAKRHKPQAQPIAAGDQRRGKQIDDFGHGVEHGPQRGVDRPGVGIVKFFPQNERGDSRGEMRQVKQRAINRRSAQRAGDEDHAGHSGDQNRHSGGAGPGQRQQRRAKDQQRRGGKPAPNAPAAAAEILAQQNRRDQAAGDAERNAHHQKQRIAQIAPEIVLRQQAPEIVESGEMQSFVLEHVVQFEVPVGKRQRHAQDQRQQREGQESADVRRNERQAEQQVAACPRIRFFHSDGFPVGRETNRHELA
ncbi:MAG: hypothetical protein BWZ10_02910 [candidate division BRC1 bacterium ADurb.BinA364]|nr:MAG: hypothetical protein BWZ10_02910 [candidate division BRC1 bacterium ADurb.BinA364]